MVTSPAPAQPPHRIAHQVRERFVQALDAAIIDLLGQLQSHLLTLAQSRSRTAPGGDAQSVDEAARQFSLQRQAWMTAARRAWREALGRADVKTSAPTLGGLSLIDDELIERKIIASRLAAPVIEAAGSEFSDLRLRMQHLERSAELLTGDVLLPETLAQILVKAWIDCGLTRPMWALVHPVVETVLVHRVPDAYRQANRYLVEQGVMAEIDMRALMRRPGSGAPSAASATPQTGSAQTEWQRTAPDRPSMARFGERTGSAGYPASEMADPPDVRPSALARAAHETRMQTGLSPMARMQQRAQGVLGQLRRMLSDRVAGFDAGVPGGAPSPALVQALVDAAPVFEPTQLLTSSGGVPQSADVVVVARRLRERAAELKAKAEKPNEKATIEIVALMFQAILAEERIPPAIRVWFARLQIPVLRLALAEPDFFASTQHPARQLIDRMGGCALGFDSARIGGSRLEAEVKRIVQVVEQYPETGRRVYQMVLEEFNRFLGSSLTEGPRAGQAATLAQQVEQKDALAVQYTIELRRMLERVPVAEPVREFLFRVWSEVLALAAVRHGPQAAESLRYKKAAADLLWSVSPKSERTERSRVVQQLAGMIHTLRDGMATLAIDTVRQDDSSSSSTAP